MPMFRKKPVVIEAVQIDKRMDLTSPAWWAEAVQQNRVILRGMGKFTRDLPVVEIETPEGIMTGVQGDWIIKGVKGELYPCKPDIFAATYEAAAGQQDADKSDAISDTRTPESIDECLALDLLEHLFDAYENGPQCYEDPEGPSGYLGHAFLLDNETFLACSDLLNRRRPRDADAARAKERQ